MPPELIATLAVDATEIGLMLTIRRDTHADNQALRAEIWADLADLLTDVQALTECVSRIEGVIRALFTTHNPRDAG